MFKFGKNLYDDYDLLVSIDSQKKLEKMKEIMTKTETLLYCMCNKENPVRMRIGKRNDRYYIASMPNQKKYHTDSCVYTSDYEAKYKVITGVEKNYSINGKDDYINFHVRSQNLNKNEFEIDYKDLLDIVQASKNKNIALEKLNFKYKLSLRQYKMTLRSFFEKILLETWKIFLYSKKRVPDGIKEFMGYFLGLSNHYCYNGNILANLYYKNDFHANKKKFFIYVFENKKGNIRNCGDIYEISVLDYTKEGLISKTIEINSLLFKKVWNKNKFKSNYMLVMGFSSGKNLNVNELELMPITENGLYIENKYEESYYNHLMKKKILFIKPWEGIQIYDNYVPDALINRNNKKTIIELFTEDLEEYKNLMKKKIEIGKQINNSNTKWEFIYYDVINSKSFKACKP